MKKVNPKTLRMIRGGYWSYTASWLREAYRSGFSPSVQHYSIGARLVRSKR